MFQHPSGPILECFQSLPDPRDQSLIAHKLLDIVVLTVLVQRKMEFRLMPLR